eukprot:scaffold930_cov193-Ochromonas_danica.AAC.2
MQDIAKLGQLGPTKEKEKKMLKCKSVHLSDWESNPDLPRSVRSEARHLTGGYTDHYTIGEVEGVLAAPLLLYEVRRSKAVILHDLC